MVFSTVIFLSLTVIHFDALGEGVEIEFEGLSPAAQQALENMSKVRKEVKSKLATPLEKLTALNETYINSCGASARPKDTGCQDQFNQIIDAHTKVMQEVVNFTDEYTNNLKIVIEELEPQMEQVAYNNSLSDINEDLLQKYEDSDVVLDDEFTQGIINAFGLGEGETQFELASGSYLEYKTELKKYTRINKLLIAKIGQARKVQVLGPIINKETQGQLSKVTNWIYGKKKSVETSPSSYKRTTVLR